MANGDPKFKTCAEAVELLRKHLTWRAKRLVVGVQGFKTQKAYAENLASFHGICTAIELMTEGGNYYAEASAAYDRARRELGQ